MITKETVFILGAGASAPYGYPTGAGLKRLICYKNSTLLSQLDPDKKSRDFTFQKDYADKIEKNAPGFIERFKQVPSDFIDRFLEANAEFPDLVGIGRILITLSILYCEKESQFLYDNNGDEIVSDWYKELFLLMNEGLRGPDAYLEFKNNKVNFITFNYDRSLEYFLYNSLIKHYGSIDPRIHKPIDLIPFKFIHVYGKIDNFPWEDEAGLEYKSKYNVRDILRVADNIKLIHERDDKFLNDIRQTIAKAKNIFFLEFGYDEDNMKALGWPEGFYSVPEIFGTAFETSQPRIEEIERMFQEDLPAIPLTSTIKPLDCRSLFNEYKNQMIA